MPATATRPAWAARRRKWPLTPTRNSRTRSPPRCRCTRGNVAGYQYGHAPSGSGRRHTFGGLTDAAFRMIPLMGGRPQRRLAHLTPHRPRGRKLVLGGGPQP